MATHSNMLAWRILWMVGHCLNSAGYWHPAGAITMSAKGHSTVLSVSCFTVMGNKVRSEKSMGKSPLLYFTGCEMSSLGSSNTALNTMTGDKVFCLSLQIPVLTKALWAEEVSLYPKKESTPIRTKCCPFHDGRSPLSSTYYRTVGWFLLPSPQEIVYYQGLTVGFYSLAYWRLSSGSSQISLVE